MDKYFLTLILYFYIHVSCDDRTSLCQFYSSTGNNVKLVNWCQNINSPCNTTNLWKGVNCTAGYVSKIDVSNLLLAGSISSLTSVQYLTYLNVMGNSLTGTIPTQIGDLSLLIYLGLSNNQISGTIPTQIGKLNYITALYLNNNALTGSIPNQFGLLSKLQLLDISQSDLSYSLTGTIPTQLGLLSDLTSLNLASNSFSGTIFTQIKFINMTILSLSNNQLVGTIPTQIGLLSKLRTLNLNQNFLSGTIPSQLGQLLLLNALLLDSNSLSGCIPPQLGLIQKPTIISLGSQALNNLTLCGCFPENWNLSNINCYLYGISYSCNCLLPSNCQLSTSCLNISYPVTTYPSPNPSSNPSPNPISSPPPYPVKSPGTPPATPYPNPNPSPGPHPVPSPGPHPVPSPGPHPVPSPGLHPGPSPTPLNPLPHFVPSPDPYPYQDQSPGPSPGSSPTPLNPLPYLDPSPEPYLDLSPGPSPLNPLSYLDPSPAPLNPLSYLGPSPGPSPTPHEPSNLSPGTALGCSIIPPDKYFTCVGDVWQLNQTYTITSSTIWENTKIRFNGNLNVDQHLQIKNTSLQVSGNLTIWTSLFQDPSSNLLVGGDMQVKQGALFNMTSGATLTVEGNLVVDGNISIALDKNSNPISSQCISGHGNLSLTIKENQQNYVVLNGLTCVPVKLGVNIISFPRVNNDSCEEEGYNTQYQQSELVVSFHFSTTCSDSSMLILIIAVTVVIVVVLFVVVVALILLVKPIKKKIFPFREDNPDFIH